MQPWWWRSVAACASVLVLAGLVAVLAAAAGADRASALHLAADGASASAPGESPGGDAPGGEAPNGVAPGDGSAGGESPGREPSASPPAVAPAGAVAPAADPERPDGAPGVPAEDGGPAPAPARTSALGRAPDARTGTSLAVLPGWRPVPTQDVVDIPPGRFGGVVLQRGEDTAVLVGAVDPARVPPRPDPAAPDPAADHALGAEARRLAHAYADLLAPRADTAALTDNAEPIAGLPTRTSVRRIEGGSLDGALVRTSTIAAPGRTIAVLAVARPSPTLEADATAADNVVRSLRLEPVP